MNHDPGTKEAQEAGCICPVIDNHYGKGYRGEAGVFIKVVGCPIHESVAEDWNPTITGQACSTDGECESCQ